MARMSVNIQSNEWQKQRDITRCNESSSHALKLAGAEADPLTPLPSGTPSVNLEMAVGWALWVGR